MPQHTDHTAVRMGRSTKHINTRDAHEAVTAVVERILKTFLPPALDEADLIHVTTPDGEKTMFKMRLSWRIEAVDKVPPPPVKEPTKQQASEETE